MKKNKLNKVELTKANEVAKNFNDVMIQIGNIKLIEYDLLVKAAQERSNVKVFKEELQKKYGNIDIDLKTGEYGESNKED
tara:strand:- start:1371 stop:1610 length:240 start_codon:yes stop_codon:yes gene_type:complete